MILEILKNRTRENPVTRAELQRETGLTDRKVRDLIADLQAQNYPIVSLSKGYFMGTPEDLLSYKRREFKRVNTMIQKLKKLIPELQAQLPLGIYDPTRPTTI